MQPLSLLLAQFRDVGQLDLSMTKLVKIQLQRPP